MSHTEEIKLALQNTARLENINGVWMPIYPEAKHENIAKIPFDATDDFPITYPQYKDYIQPKHSICTDSAEELKEIAHEYNKIKPNILNMIAMESDIEHESQHAEIIRLLGGLAIYNFGLVSNYSLNYSGVILSATAFNLTTNKIGVALINAYPKRPSSLDMLGVHKLGYNDIDEVDIIATSYGLPKMLSKS